MSPRRLAPSSGRRRDVHERALGLLAARQRSRAELQRRLLGAGFGAEEVATELERLEQVGLIDDRAFAQALAEHAIRSRGEGRRAVGRRLAAAGVDRATADQILSGLAEQDEGDRALDLARGRVGRLAGLTPDRAFSRLTSFLTHRGYAPDVARWAAGKALALEDVEG